MHDQSIHPPPPSSSSVKPPSSPMMYRLSPAWPFSATNPSTSSGACSLTVGLSAGSVGRDRRGYVQPFEAGGMASGKRRVVAGLEETLNFQSGLEREDILPGRTDIEEALEILSPSKIVRIEVDLLSTRVLLADIPSLQRELECRDRRYRVIR